ncbi:hypothetical protein D1AOALGA4SA_1599 [Olavius algarvensis Delta 1 endosymbiont]|nr:hypothetical protein D1AOALGA4SA_1599 [Olavius algarvensis Delta 1 endosymbiont]
MNSSEDEFIMCLVFCVWCLERCVEGHIIQLDQQTSFAKY